MSKFESIENEVWQLKATALAAFRRWFHEFDAEAWDWQIERDVKTGRLNKLAKNSLKAHKDCEKELQ